MGRYLIIVLLLTALVSCGASSALGHGQAGPAQAAVSSGFAKAKAVWKQTASVAAAEVSRDLRQAASDLKEAGTGGYSSAIRELMELAALPETGTTPAQQAEARTDLTALDKFFGTPGLTPNG
jgi:hypothetical protein